jgi:hypothetical protein
MDQIRRPHPGFHRALLPTNSRIPRKS